MQTVEELENYYETHLSEKVNALEQTRKTINQRIIRIMGASIVLFFILVLFGTDPLITLVALAIIGGIAAAIATGSKAMQLKKDFKEQIIASLISFINEDLSYNHKRGVSQQDFLKSKLFKQRCSRYKSEDYVWGKIGQTEISFSEVHAEEKHTDNKGRTSYSTIFKGMFFIGDFHKEFHGETYVLPNIVGRMFGGLGRMLQSMNTGRPSKVRLEDPEFNKEFVVYSSDQIECRYILTPSLMQRILNFKKTHPKRMFYISFVGDCVFVAITFNKALFEPSLFKPLNNFSQIKEYYEDLYLAVSIVEEFNLNTRIWTKA